MASGPTSVLLSAEEKGCAAAETARRVPRNNVAPQQVMVVFIPAAIDAQVVPAPWPLSSTPIRKDSQEPIPCGMATALPALNSKHAALV